ncbi:MAG: SUMF1/EgtB/PvdO family nonheme iron enzyme, partial [Bacteroidales bacterium]|nr:SUMF1/EgtB/PvdO family nonheme iron enzyme [Bacteroidales bacterium]
EDTGHTAGNSALADYRVTSRDGQKKKYPMTYELGKSVVYKQWRIDPEEDSVVGNVGLFLYRKDSLGAGNVVVPGVSLLWNYADQGFTYDDDLVVKVFAVEMVYVPQGAFYLGGVGTVASQVGSFTSNANTFGYPFHVKSEKAITLANTASDTTLWSIGGMGAGTLPADFPKGYQAFYIMKYELTQEAYADFLNTLNQGQQDGRIQGTLASIAVGGSIWNGAANALVMYRHFIEVSQRAPTVTFGVDAATTNNNKWNETKMVTRKFDDYTDSCLMGIDGQDLAVNFVSMYDLLAYADFAGLRPMTELEYEKACRGDRPVVTDEFAWGTTTKTYFQKGFNLTNASWYSYYTDFYIEPNTGNEHVPDDYNCGSAHGYHQVDRINWWDNNWTIQTYAAPLRVGCFADSTSTRAAAGATYWGVMNMSDNCSELCISVGNANTGFLGRSFVGVHGDGQLLANGNANVADWAMPNEAAAKVAATSANYYIPRGMGFPTAKSGWAGGDWGTHRGQNWLTGENINAGMISSRAYFGHGIPMTQREYASFMPGIRCVRTAGAEK